MKNVINPSDKNLFKQQFSDKNYFQIRSKHKDENKNEFFKLDNVLHSSTQLI